MDYSRALVLAILEHLDEIEAYVYRVTSPLSEAVYIVDTAQEKAFDKMGEGKTLWNYAAQTTRSVKRNGFREQLLDMLVDIQLARKYLTDEENVCLWAIYIARPTGRPKVKIKETADIALEKMIFHLNGSCPSTIQPTQEPTKPY